MPNPALIADFIYTFDQYGSPDAPWWVIGSEEAGVADLADFEKRLNVWDSMGRRPVVDVADFHSRIGVNDLFHLPKVRVQSTWRNIIRLLLTAQTGHAPSNQAIHDCQRDRFGRHDGDVWLTELHPLPAKSEKHWIYQPYASLPDLGFLADRTSYLRHCGPRKVARIRAMLEKSRAESRPPKVIICYGSHNKQWDTIAAAPIDTPMVSGARYTSDQETLFLVTRHPKARGTKNSYWEETGLALHSLL